MAYVSSNESMVRMTNGIRVRYCLECNYYGCNPREVLCNFCKPRMGGRPMFEHQVVQRDKPARMAMEEKLGGVGAFPNYELRERALELSVLYGDKVFLMIRYEAGYGDSSQLMKKLGIQVRGKNKYGDKIFQDYLSPEHYKRIDDALFKLERGLAEAMRTHPRRSRH